MKAVRSDIALLEQNGITGVAFPRLNDPSVIPLWFGEGDVVTPEFICKVAKDALDNGDTFYQHTRGKAELREAITSYLNNLYQVDLSPERISVPGSSMLCVTIAAQMALNKGDEALIISPHWPNIETTYRITGATINTVRQRETEHGWQLTAEEIIEAVTPGTRSIFLNSPCNPTGWVMGREDQELLLGYCRENNILLIADEVYHRHVFDRTAAPSFIEIAKEDDPVVVVNGFSKAWAMTGWRVGWVVAPTEQATHWALMSECFNTGATVFAQPAGIAALEQGEDFVNQLKSQYQRGRDIVIDAFSDFSPVELAAPEGAFYAFPKVRGVTSSRQFAEQLLAKEDVGVAPGYTFGPGNESHIRICYAQSHEKLEEGLSRIKRYINQYHNDL